MYNLIVKARGWAEGRDTFSADRTFEFTDDALEARFKPNERLDTNALTQLPTLFMSEGFHNQFARVGTLTRIRSEGRELSLQFTYDEAIPPILNRHLQAFRADLDIREWEFTRTHWAIKDEDLFRVLLRNIQPRRLRPNVFQITDHENIEPALVSAMMPFDGQFDAVYETLQGISEDCGLRCRRADDIWENPTVIQDVVSLIDRSRVVIADCTNRNPNVFYEIGIAHTLGRDVILITQSEADVPFDLRHLRFVQYLNNGEGLADLAQQLRQPLENLA
ncbi:MAG: hypothetical protein AAF709_04040 [Pseudomonadota bacterium]